MSQTSRHTRGMAVAPHALAAQSALAVLREGGNAVEAMISAAATIAVVYPHMNSIGGDAFWLIHMPGHAPTAIDACGASAAAATIPWYRERGITEAIPARGGVAANTVAGTVSGWELALEISHTELGGRMPLSRLLRDAIHHAKAGVAVTRSQSETTRVKLEGLAHQPGFADTFLVHGSPPEAGSLFRQPKLAQTLESLVAAGLDDFYRGEIGRGIAKDLEAVGSPLHGADLAQHRAVRRSPLRLDHSRGTLYNMTPPTQGVVSLLILGILDRLRVQDCAPDSADYVHLCVEATKLAFEVRDRYVTDPDDMEVTGQELLSPKRIDELAARVDRRRAQPWGTGRGPADTVWLGVVDGKGCAVSFIQSLYHEYGSGVVLPHSGINWQNRGCSFSLQEGKLNSLRPGRKPFHTLNPALASLADGRTMVYGNMGGDGQPQTQSAVFTRTVLYGMTPQAAISAPRWLLGRTWGQASDSLKLEARFPPDVVARLREMGHEVEMLGDFDETVGHAGAILRHADGTLEGGSDPRSDGGVAAF